jgi:S-layer protein
MTSISQRNQTRNQSTADFQQKKIFIFDNKYQNGVFNNNSGGALTIQSGMFLARNIATPQKSTVVFVALTNGQTVILGGLTFTAGGSGATAEAVANAFANLAVGATDGPGTASGAYSGTLAGFSTGGVINGKSVVFTSSVTGASTALAATGTGSAPAITVVAGTAGATNGFIQVTSANLADVIGIADLDDSVVTANGDNVNISCCTGGSVESTFLVMPAGVTLATIVGNKTFQDVLEGIGFHLITGVSNTKFDN